MSTNWRTRTRRSLSFPLNGIQTVKSYMVNAGRLLVVWAFLDNGLLYTERWFCKQNGVFSVDRTTTVDVPVSELRFSFPALQAKLSGNPLQFRGMTSYCLHCVRSNTVRVIYPTRLWYRLTDENAKSMAREGKGQARLLHSTSDMARRRIRKRF